MKFIELNKEQRNVTDTFLSVVKNHSEKEWHPTRGVNFFKSARFHFDGQIITAEKQYRLHLPTADDDLTNQMVEVLHRLLPEGGNFELDSRYASLGII